MAAGSGLFGQGGGFGSGTVNDIGGAVNDLLQGQVTAQTDEMKAAGDFAEAQTYGLAKTYAGASGELQEAQEQRALAKAQGATQSEVAAAGFSQSGSALDIMRSNAQQGAVAQQTIQANTNLNVESDTIEQNAAQAAGEEELSLGKTAVTDSYISAGVAGIAAFASLA